MLTSLNPRAIAKFTTMAAVSLGVKSATDLVIESTTDIDTDSFPVDLSTTVFGAVVAVKLSPKTDAVVDLVADKRIARKIAKNAKKQTPES